MFLFLFQDTFKSTSEPRIEVSEEGNKLTCLTGGIPAYAFRWERSGMDIKPSCKYSIISNGYDNSVLIINGGGSEDSGEYKCIFYSYYQDSASVSVSRNVEVEGNITLIISYYFIHVPYDNAWNSALL